MTAVGILLALALYLPIVVLLGAASWACDRAPRSADGPRRGHRRSARRTEAPRAAARRFTEGVPVVIDARTKLREVLDVLRAAQRWVRVRRAHRDTQEAARPDRTGSPSALAPTRAEELQAEQALEAAWSALEGEGDGACQG